MTLAQHESRLERLEKEVKGLRQPARNGKWWIENSGTFKDDKVYALIVRMGREYRNSLKPKKNGGS